ncbi:MAG TPA: triose-phosphate isomerase [Candidatus Binatia bacterium]|jgi:triosephosphate isomerase|nr:triose-phosphate isomerase [Candidatus Binatia bacterium]
MTPLVVGNWKMHGTLAEAAALAREVLNGGQNIAGVELALAPPFTALSTVAAITRDSLLFLAAQNVHWEMRGAFTGEISPEMVLELGCRYAIIGHSERRHIFHESDEVVAKKVAAAAAAGLQPILCVGETLDERQADKTAAVVSRQLKTALKGLGKDVIKIVSIAYEPVWAIGTGHNATPEQVEAVHRQVRGLLRELGQEPAAADCRILYGGSVKPENAAELAAVPEVNGFLVGGASLKADSFLTIARACRRG